MIIPPNAQHGQVLHLPDQGLPYYDSGPHGPLLLTLSTDEDKATSSLVNPAEDNFPTVPAASSNLVKQPPSIASINGSLLYINELEPISPMILGPVPSPSEPVLPVDNTVPLPLSLGLPLPADSVNNRNLPSKQHTTLFITVALVLLIIGSVLAIASVNNTIATNNANATATTQSIINANATATTQSIIQATTQSIANANATATSQVIANSTATAIAANPDPYQPPSGTLALVDLLSQPSVWENASDTNSGGQCQFVHGAYQISQPQPNKLYQCPEGNQYSNFAFEVKMTINQGDCGGLSIRSQSNYSNLYLFQVCQDGTYDFYKYTLSSPSSPIRLMSGNSPAINQGTGKSNLIAVVANGSSFNLYINNQKIDNASDNTYSQGSLGLVAGAYNNPTRVTYQNARIWIIR